MPENRLGRFGIGEQGEILTAQHRTVLQKCDNLLGQGNGPEAREAALLQRNAELEERLQQMIDAEEERLKNELAATSSHAERAALKRLEEAQVEIESKDSEIRKMHIALEAARDELHKLSAQKSELRRELEDERSELHRLRQEKRTTELPLHVFDDLPSHSSPRQMAHPELRSPRQAQRQQLRAASASATRPSTVLAQRPMSARPAATTAAPSIGASSGGSKSAREIGTSGHAAGTAAGIASGIVRHEPTPPASSITPSGSGGPRHVGIAGEAAVAGSLTPRGAAERAMARMQLHQQASAASSSGACCDSSGMASHAPSSRDPAKAALEKQLVELQRANARLQTALLAAALDPDGCAEPGGLLAGIDRGLSRRSGPSHTVSSMSQRNTPRSPAADKAWPFTRSKLPTGTKLPRGYVQPSTTWPPMM